MQDNVCGGNIYVAVRRIDSVGIGGRREEGGASRCSKMKTGIGGLVGWETVS